jgi:hypothetical protein
MHTNANWQGSTEKAKVGGASIRYGFGEALITPEMKGDAGAASSGSRAATLLLRQRPRKDHLLTVSAVLETNS